MFGALSVYISDILEKPQLKDNIIEKQQRASFGLKSKMRKNVMREKYGWELIAQTANRTKTCCHHCSH